MCVRGCRRQGKHMYHPGVIVKFQKCAWADTELTLSYVKEHLLPWADKQYDGQQWLMFMDN